MPAHYTGTIQGISTIGNRVPIQVELRYEANSSRAERFHRHCRGQRHYSTGPIGSSQLYLKRCLRSGEHSPRQRPGRNGRPACVDASAPQAISTRLTPTRHLLDIHDNHRSTQSALTVQLNGYVVYLVKHNPWSTGLTARRVPDFASIIIHHNH